MDPKKKKTIIAVVAGVVVIVCAVAAFVLLNKPKVGVPDVVYFERAEAEKQLTDAGLKLGKVTEEASTEIPIGDIVLKTDPAPGSSVEKGSTVNVVLSTGPKMSDSVEVPDLKGLTPEEAEKKLFDAFFIPQQGKQVYSDTVEAGKVCSQSIAAGSKVKLMSEVTYSVSLGKEKVGVPDVKGKNINEARDILKKAGLSCDTTNSYSDTVAKDAVISQNVAKDIKVDKGTIITLEVSLGKKPAAKVVVPNIMTYTLEDAKRALDSAGLKYQYSGDENGSVVAVRPVPFTEVDQGSTVTFELKAPESAPQQNTSEQNNTQQNNTQQNNNNEQSNESQSQDDDQNNGLTPRYSRDECIAIATDAMGAGGQAKGPANNISSTDLIEGGGTLYCVVEFDLGDVHYTVTVDAVDGGVINSSETFNGVERMLDEDGVPIEGSAQEVD